MAHYKPTGTEEFVDGSTLLIGIMPLPLPTAPAATYDCGFVALTGNRFDRDHVNGVDIGEVELSGLVPAPVSTRFVKVGGLT